MLLPFLSVRMGKVLFLCASVKNTLLVIFNTKSLHNMQKMITFVLSK